MPTQVTSAFRRLGIAIREFTIAQRTIALIGVAVLVLGIAGLSVWLAKPTYTPLFSGLEGADANSIVEQLRTDSIPYELSDGGATIMVPEEFVYDQRLKSAAAGLPSSSTGGYSLLDDMGVTSSEFQQSVTYKRALEGELAATISAMKGVQTASVRLAIPEETVFVATKAEPTASVFVETKNGVTLTAEQVQAIVHLTSASIDGMKTTNVAVIDSKGTVLSAVGVGATGTSDKQAADYEERVQGAVQAMLDQVVGPGNATVVVAADMSYESAQRTEETFTAPDEALALSESIDTNNYSGAGENAAGVLGPDNIAVPAEDGDGAYTSESTTRNNAVNKVTEQRSIPSGSINRQTVSVALNEEAAADLNIGDLTTLVSTAAGINPARGDEVAVEVVSFNKVGAQEAAKAIAAAEEAAAAERFAAILRTVIITIGIVLPIIISLFLVGRRSRRQSREQLELDELAEHRAILNGATVPISMVATPAPRPIEPMTEVLTADAPDSDRRRAEIDALAGKDPARTAEFLRSLMDDRQNA
ncbi:MAG: flagellar M-ring protein FliF [Homoserinimonas sp.]|jgi:flagellar M-ring protein FliF|nr:flagellar M-ring protein FliF [Homoserinimonas sp.]